jgi:hypothetical protein
MLDGNCALSADDDLTQGPQSCGKAAKPRQWQFRDFLIWIMRGTIAPAKIYGHVHFLT